MQFSILAIAAAVIGSVAASPALEARQATCPIPRYCNLSGTFTILGSANTGTFTGSCANCTGTTCKPIGTVSLGVSPLFAFTGNASVRVAPSMRSCPWITSGTLTRVFILSDLPVSQNVLCTQSGADALILCTCMPRDLFKAHSEPESVTSPQSTLNLPAVRDCIENPENQYLYDLLLLPTALDILYCLELETEGRNLSYPWRPTFS